MIILRECGFVEARANDDRKPRLVLLPNPDVVLSRLWRRAARSAGGLLEPAGLAGLLEATISAFLERAIDVRANDVAEQNVRLSASAEQDTASAAKPAKTPRSRSGTCVS